ncbi:MAG: RidA family protein [Chloroflexota bacterium]
MDGRYQTTKSQEAIKTAEAPQPVGPYSQAVRLGQFVFVSGSIGLDPGTGKLVGDDVASQTRQVLQNMEAVLRASGSSLDSVLKTTVFLMDMADFPVMNGIYAEHFAQVPPSRSTIQVAGLPAGARVEIEAIAYVP